jgi:hypothetical protein
MMDADRQPTMLDAAGANAVAEFLIDVSANDWGSPMWVELRRRCPHPTDQRVAASESKVICCQVCGGIVQDA